MSWRSITVSEQRQKFLEDDQLNYYPFTDVTQWIEHLPSKH